MPLLAWVVALLAVVVGALFGVAELDDAWAVAVAVGAALAATLTVVLARATLADQSAFNAPAGAWRIASGATSLARGT
jgi:low affinity Fe/Cu permease